MAVRSAQISLDTDKVANPTKGVAFYSGIRDCTLAELRIEAATNERRRALWHQLICFLAWPVLSRKFSYLYVAGGYNSDKENPHDIDVVLETCEPYGPSSLLALEPYFAIGLENIISMFSIHLHFWMDDPPPGMTDFRAFFQQGRSPGVDKPGPGRHLLRISLQGAEIKKELMRELELIQGAPSQPAPAK